MTPIRVGLIGYGLAGKIFHAPLIDFVPELALHTIVSSRPEAVKADFPQVTVLPTAAELMAREEIDLVVVATPNHLHAPLAEAALKTGKHVVVDKPFVTRSADADALIALAEAQGQVLSVFQNRRWDNDFLTVRQLLENGRLGNLYSLEIRYDRFRPHVRARWREQPGDGVGMLFDLGAHLIDQALVLCGWPHSLQADVFGQRPSAAVDDYFHLVLSYGDLRVVLHSSSFVADSPYRYAIFGDKGSFIKKGLDPQEDQLKAGLRPAAADWGQDPAALYGRLTTVDEEGTRSTRIPTLPGAYQDYYAALAQAIREGAPPPVTAQAGRDVIRIIEAGLEAASSGKKVVL